MNHPAKPLIFLIFLATATSMPARAQSPGGTLAKIRDSGEITLGHRAVSLYLFKQDVVRPIRQ